VVYIKPTSSSEPSLHNHPNLSLSLSHTHQPSMAAGLSTAANLKPYNLLQPPIPLPKPNQSLLFHPFKSFHQSTILRLRPPRRTAGFSVCVLAEDPKRNLQIKTNEEEEQELNPGSASARVEEKLARKRSQRFTYLVAAVMSSFGVTSMAVFAVYYRFSWQMEVPTKLFKFSFFALRLCCFLNPNIGLCCVGWRFSLV